MREIKFRAWDKKLKCLRYDVSLDFDGDTVFEQMPDRCGCQDGFIERMDSVELMQYTGLKDKNGVEIYEGDICKYPYVRSSAINYSIEIDQVGWDDEYCGFTFQDIDGYTEQNIGGFCGIERRHLMDIEVIGNIYENQELLEKDNK